MALIAGPRSFVLRGVDLHYPNQLPVTEFLLGARELLGGRDLSIPLKVYPPSHHALLCFARAHY
jgi:hypothetical protein